MSRRINDDFLLLEDFITNYQLSKYNSDPEQIEKYISINMSNKKYYATLIYENAVLQLLNRIEMSKEEYSTIFLKYRTRFRKEFFSILLKNDVTFKSKVYMLVLCSSPRIFRKFSNAVLGRKENV